LKGANVVVDQEGRARLTDYGLAPINPDLSFTVAATPGAVGTSRWLAPEIISPVRKGSTLPVMESRPADVFAFAMLAVEVFTGKIPFDEQKNEAVVLHISRGGRPEMPGNAQAVGLTVEMWRLLGSCWHQNPKKRPTMEEVVRRWKKFVENNMDNNVLHGDPSPGVGPESGTSRRRAMSDATRPQVKPRDARHRTMSEAPHSRGKSEALLLRPLSAYQPEASSEAIQQETRSDVQLQTQTSARRQIKPKKRWWFCGLF